MTFPHVVGRAFGTNRLGKSGWTVAVVLLICATGPVEAHTSPEALERFDVESPSYVHVYRDKCGTQAIIQDPDGYSYMVHPYSRLGRNYGVVTSVTEEGVRFAEVIQDADGQWYERHIEMTRAAAVPGKAFVFKDPLQQFDLKTLTFRGVSDNGCELRAVLLHDYHVYVAYIGSRMGRNAGIVTSISKNRIALRERHRKPDGTWFEKDVFIKVKRY